MKFFKPTWMIISVWLFLNIILILGFMNENINFLSNTHHLVECVGGLYEPLCFNTAAAALILLEFAAFILVLNSVVYFLSCVIVSIMHKLKKQQRSRKH